jgi:methanethiol S-methyltransferase
MIGEMQASHGAPTPAPYTGRPSAAARVAAWAGGIAFVAALGFFLYSYLVRFGRPAPEGPWLPATLVNLALFTAFAMHHSLFARTPLKAWVRRTAEPRLERSLYVWISSLLFLAVCWLWRPVPGELYRLGGLWWWMGVAIMGVGMLLTQLGSRALDPLHLAGIRQVEKPDEGAPPQPLVTAGVYRLVRHPFYLGWALLVFGAPHMTLTRFTFAVISTLYLMAAIPWEERSLRESFGPAYADYQRRVRWRMLPFVY